MLKEKYNTDIGSSDMLNWLIKMWLSFLCLQMMGRFMNQHFMYNLFISLTIIVTVIVFSLLSSGSEKIFVPKYDNFEEHKIPLFPNIVTSTTRHPNHDGDSKARRCFSNHFNVQDRNIQLFPDIMTATKKPTFGKSIFFHETSCSKGIAKLNAR